MMPYTRARTPREMAARMSTEINTVMKALAVPTCIELTYMGMPPLSTLAELAVTVCTSPAVDRLKWFIAVTANDLGSAMKLPKLEVERAVPELPDASAEPTVAISLYGLSARLTRLIALPVLESAILPPVL